jgi:hypothetical protein
MWPRVDRQKVPRTEGVNQRRKCISAITPTTRVGRAAWAGLWASAYRRGERPAGPTGPTAEWAARSAGPKAKKRISELKIGFLNLPSLWKFAQGDLGGILT